MSDALADAYTEIHRRDQRIAPGSESPILWAALTDLKDSTDLIANLNWWRAAYDLLDAAGDNPVAVEWAVNQILYSGNYETADALRGAIDRLPTQR